MKNYRKRKVRRIKLILTICIACIITITSSFLTTHIFASEGPDNAITYKYYKSIVVEYGMTVWDYAIESKDEYQGTTTSYIKEVSHINSLDENYKIEAGRRLIVPYHSTELK
ncbi:MAG: hypothetical protein ACRC7V_04150 [Lachnospiraceae bacterium]